MKNIKILVFGVTHWNNKNEMDKIIPQILDWKNRIISNVGSHIKFFLTTGTYSEGIIPIYIPVYQNKVKFTNRYNIEWNYFRNGFMTGIWKALLDYKFDILFHIQPRILIGKSIRQELEDFWNDKNSIIMAPKLTYDYGIDVEISMIAMKREAVETYATSALRHSLSQVPLGAFNCEKEAENLFFDRWYNPWYKVKTIRKYPMVRREDCEYNLTAEQVMELPFISTGDLHIEKEDVEEWKIKHPVKF